MPLFQLKDQSAAIIKPTKFGREKELQALVEQNLEAIFSCRFVATEFSTGANHAGRIDTLALSEDHNPVIIEYKIVESSDLINQSLFYLSWMADHKGDFEVAVNKALGHETEVDWSDIRVICLAPGYKKYDLHAVKMMGANIELWKYRLYENGVFQLDEVFTSERKKSSLTVSSVDTAKNPVMVAAGKKAAETRRLGEYTYEGYLEGKPDKLVAIVGELREFIMDLDDSIEENPKKLYIAYKTTKNFVCIEVQRSKILVYLKLDLLSLSPVPTSGRDVTNIGHFGTGNFEYTLKPNQDLDELKGLIELSLQYIGG